MAKPGFIALIFPQNVKVVAPPPLNGEGVEIEKLMAVAHPQLFLFRFFFYGSRFLRSPRGRTGFCDSLGAVIQ